MGRAEDPTEFLFYSKSISREGNKMNLRFLCMPLAIVGIACLAFVYSGAAMAVPNKPNIVVIWGDDVGYWNVSAYNQGMMGYDTPNIDSVASEGALFTDWYAQQSCTAGRAALILGQHPSARGCSPSGCRDPTKGSVMIW